MNCEKSCDYAQGPLGKLGTQVAAGMSGAIEATKTGLPSTPVPDQAAYARSCRRASAMAKRIGKACKVPGSC